MTQAEAVLQVLRQSCDGQTAHEIWRRAPAGVFKVLRHAGVAAVSAVLQELKAEGKVIPVEDAAGVVRWTLDPNYEESTMTACFNEAGTRCPGNDCTSRQIHYDR